jgi:hypothetical protein
VRAVVAPRAAVVSTRLPLAALGLRAAQLPIPAAPPAAVGGVWHGLARVGVHVECGGRGQVPLGQAVAPDPHGARHVLLPLHAALPLGAHCAWRARARGRPYACGLRAAAALRLPACHFISHFCSQVFSGYFQFDLPAIAVCQVINKLAIAKDAMWK